jgi:hypothetical protein
MKKLLTFLGCLCIASNLLLAQQLQLDWVEYEPFNRSASFDIFLSDSSYLYIGGSSNSDTTDFDFTNAVYEHIPNGYSDAYWGKYRKSDMGLEELFIINGSGSEDITDMKRDESGNYYILCMFDSSNTDIAPLSSQSYTLNTYGNYDIALAKYSSFGQLIWARHLGGATGYDLARKLILDTHGHIYIGGYFSNTVWIDSTASIIINRSVGVGTPFFAKYDTSGTLQWIKTFPANNSGCQPISVLDPGAVVVSGWFRDSIYIENQWYYQGNGSSITSFVAVFDTSGSISWVDTIGGSLQNAQLVDKDEQSIYLTTDTEDDTKKFSFVKYNLFGNRIFNKTVKSTAFVGPSNLILKDSAIYLFGSFSDTLTFDGVLYSQDTFTNAPYCTAIFVAKCSKDGIWQWVEKTACTTAFLAGGSFITSMGAQDNDIYAGLQTSSLQPSPLINIAFEPAVFQIPASKGIAKYHFTTTGISTINDAQENTLKLFPNPAQDLLMLQSEEGIDYVEIYDMQGRKIWSQKWYGVPVSVAAIPQGVYFVLSFDAVGRQNGQGKLVVVR